MSWQKKLTEWQNAQLISSDTAHAIEQYEAQQPNFGDSLWRYGLMGLATLCVGLGIWFIVAANWQDIPFSVKLGTHVLFNLVLGGIIIRMLVKNEQKKWAMEIPVLILSGAQLSLMALIGQYLQISSPIEDVMLFWFALIAPLLLLLGRTSFSALLFFGLGIFVFLAKLDIRYQALFIPIITGLTAFYLISFIPWLQRTRTGWSDIMRITGYYGAILLACTLIVEPTLFIQYDYRYFAGQQINMHIGASILLTAMTAWIYLKCRTSFYLTTHRDETEVLILSLGAIALTQFSLTTGTTETLKMVVFCLYFLVIGYIAHHYKKRALTAVAILAVAIRMIIYFASLWNNMLLNGVVMIVIGILTILALRQFATKKGVTA